MPADERKISSKVLRQLPHLAKEVNISNGQGSLQELASQTVACESWQTSRVRHRDDFNINVAGAFPSAMTNP